MGDGGGRQVRELKQTPAQRFLQVFTVFLRNLVHIAFHSLADLCFFSPRVCFNNNHLFL